MRDTVTLQGLRAIREERSLSQEAVARLANLSSQHVSRLERGLYSATLTTARALAEALGCTIDELITPPEKVTA